MLAALAGAAGVLVATLARGPSAAVGGWTMFMHDNARSGFDPSETAINPRTAGRLTRAWTVKVTGAISTQATVAGGLVYWGSWDGVEHATDAASGKEVWHRQIGSETNRKCYPVHIGVASTATIATVTIKGRATRIAFVGGGAGSYYALDADTGRVLWSRFLGSPRDGYFMWSSPAVWRGSVYVGVASVADCPLVPGSLLRLDAATGVVQSRFATVPAGCTGGTVWSSPAIDDATGTLYVDTGNDSGACRGQAEPYAQAMLKLTSDLKIISAWRIPDRQQVNDSDFGATPNLFTASIGGIARRLVGAADKNGIYYAFRRDRIEAGPVWETRRITTAGQLVGSAAWDGQRLYVAGSKTVIGGTYCEASVRAVDPSSGRFVWSSCLPGGANLSSVAAAPGTVWATSGPILYGLRSSDGHVLGAYIDRSGAWYYAPPMFSGDALFIGGYDGRLDKFTPRRPMNPAAR